MLKSTIAGAEDDRISLHDYISTVVDYGTILLNTHNEDKAEKKVGELLKGAPTAIAVGGLHLVPCRLVTGDVLSPADRRVVCIEHRPNHRRFLSALRRRDAV